MLVQSIRVVLTVAVAVAGFSSYASAEQCKTTVVKYNHFRPAVVVVQNPVLGTSTDTTPLLATAPGHNRPPSPLVTQPTPVMEVPCVEAGEELDVDVNFAMKATGTVILRTGKFEMELPVTSWSARCVKFQLPNIGMLECMPVSIHIYRPDGYLVRQFSAKIVRSNSIRRIVRAVQYEATVSTATTANPESILMVQPAG